MGSSSRANNSLSTQFATPNKALIGAVELVVPGNLPIGCSSVYLTLFQNPNKYFCDRNGCLKAFNAFSKYHNSEIKRSLGKLREKHPHARIIYADYYGAAMHFYHAPHHHGGVPYNFNSSATCGSQAQQPARIHTSLVCKLGWNSLNRSSPRQPLPTS